MKSRQYLRIGIEIPAFVALLCALGISGMLSVRNVSERNKRVAMQSWISAERTDVARSLQFEAVVPSHRAQEALQSMASDQTLFSGELRVAAIGSAYPIPYAAEVCPFTNIPQPAMNQLDRDGDGITDDWELRYGLDKYSKDDALSDPDQDGFSNLEEFQSGTDPRNLQIHPPYVEKLRFVERKDIPFPLVFQGVTKLSDGSLVFQLNSPADGLTHFAALGESVEGVLLQRFIAASDGQLERLVVSRDSAEVILIRGEISADPESQAELINILDRSPIIVTMGALLSLRNDEYIVLSVHHDKIVVRQIKSGKVFDITGLADEEP